MCPLMCGGETTRGHSGNRLAGRDVAGHDRARADQRVFTDRDAAENDRAATVALDGPHFAHHTVGTTAQSASVCSRPSAVARG